MTEVNGKTNADKAMDTVNKVGGALSRQLVAGDKPKVITVVGMNIEISQVTDEIDEDETGFGIPLISKLSNTSEDSATSSVGAMVSIFICRLL